MEILACQSFFSPFKEFTGSDFPLHFGCSCSWGGNKNNQSLLCLPPTRMTSLPSEGTLGFMASDRKSIERTDCNPTITPSPNEETVIQSLSLYLSKTDFRLYDQECVSLSRSQPVCDLTTVYFETAVKCLYNSFALICSFLFFFIPPSPVSLKAAIWL